jgi:hypothetical protein
MAEVRRIVAEFAATNKALGEIAAFTRGLEGTLTSARRLATGLLAMAGVGGIGYMISQELKAIDSTAKLSDRLGISTENLIALQYGAKMTGVETETLNTSLEFFSRRLGQIQLGGNVAKDSLDALGLSTRDLAGLNADNAIGLFTDKIQSLGSQTQKAAVIQDLFGRGSRQLMNLLTQGSGVIVKYRAETEKLGLSFSRIDAAQVEAADEALTRLRFVFTGIFTQITIKLAPFIEALAKSFTDFATSGEGLGVKISYAFEIVALSIVNVGEEVENLIIRMNRLTSPVESLKKNIEAVRLATERYREVTGEGKRLSPGQPDLFNKIYMEERAKVGLEPPEGRQSQVQAWFENLRTQSRLQAEAAAAGKAAGGGEINPLEGAGKMTAEEEKKVLETTRNAIDQMRHMDYLTRNERIENLKDYQAANADTLGQVGDANKLLNDEILNLERSRLDAMKVYLAELRDDMQNSALYISEKFADTSRSIEGSLSSAFQSMISGGKSFRDAMSQFFIDVGNSFAKMAADMAARALMANLMSSFFGGFGGGNFAPTAAGPMSNIEAGGIHGGGIVGVDLPAFTRTVPASVFATAPRLHGGSDEYAAILKRKEGVFTEEQMKRLGPADRSQVQNENQVQAGRSIIINISAMDSQDVKRALQKNKGFLNDLVYGGMKANHPIRRYEK